MTVQACMLIVTNEVHKATNKVAMAMIDLQHFHQLHFSFRMSAITVIRTKRSHKSYQQCMAKAALLIIIIILTKPPN